MELKEYKSEYCTIFYLKEKNAIFCKWLKKCTKKDYRAPLIYGLKLLEVTRAESWITDTTEGFKNEVEDSEWLVQEFIPQTIKSNCKRVVFIVDNDSFLKAEIDEQCKALDEYFEVLQVEKMMDIKG